VSEIVEKDAKAVQILRQGQVAAQDPPQCPAFGSATERVWNISYQISMDSGARVKLQMSGSIVGG
jgi:hypothetical protein